jgi:hypothetical protein
MIKFGVLHSEVLCDCGSDSDSDDVCMMFLRPPLAVQSSWCTVYTLKLSMLAGLPCVVRNARWVITNSGGLGRVYFKETRHYNFVTLQKFILGHQQVFGIKPFSPIYKMT